MERDPPKVPASGGMTMFNPAFDVAERRPGDDVDEMPPTPAPRDARRRDAAEVVALRAAATALGSWRLDGCTLVVTLEPCTMCAGAVLAARVPRLVFGAWDEKAGAVGSVYDVLRDGRVPHRTEVVAGVDGEACAALLTAFFADRR